ncbi:hypothetical protein FYJ24_02510 [Actinomycetaceae bacterium WB03_NA08]|uniref:Uncharacterized protein n=1 Tax=Scrofimicrobium canadense TaxID=2652290 RepID=A0A6N7W567_9ACTO|nr:hypothetical protein [Scrofimicrobium canadense]MSS83653.1 hypothetical protein [Scrofimicrobium canadense]
MRRHAFMGRAVATCVAVWSLVACADSSDDLGSKVIYPPNPKTYELAVNVPPELTEQEMFVHFSHSKSMTFMGAAALWIQSGYQDQRAEETVQEVLESGLILTPDLVRPLTDVLDAYSSEGLPMRSVQQVLSWEPATVRGEDSLTAIAWQYCFPPQRGQSQADTESEECILIGLVSTGKDEGWAIHSVSRLP